MFKEDAGKIPVQIRANAPILDATKNIEQIKQITGPRLTCFMVDNTRIYHLGSRMGKGERRSVFMTHFVDPVGEKDWVKGGSIPEDEKLLVSRG